MATSTPRCVQEEPSGAVYDSPNPRVTAEDERAIAVLGQTAQLETTSSTPKYRRHIM